VTYAQGGEGGWKDTTVAASGGGGVANLGGGGGGGSNGNTSPGGSNGASGVVIVRYPNIFGTAFSITGGTITYAGGYTIHTFNDTSSLVVV
jgi:hypothetical protein